MKSQLGTIIPSSSLRLCFWSPLWSNHLFKARPQKCLPSCQNQRGGRVENCFQHSPGHFEYLLMPFGLTYASAVFPVLINDERLVKQKCILYIDDIYLWRAYKSPVLPSFSSSVGPQPGLLEYAHSALVSSVTGMSPCMATNGFQPPLFPSQETEVTVLSVQAQFRWACQVWHEA